MRMWPIKFKKGSVVLVVGGGTGIGRELVYKYASRGCPVVVSDKSEKQLESVVHRCNNDFKNSDVLPFVANPNSEAEVATLIDFTSKAFGRIDIVILAGGVEVLSLFEDLNDFSDLHLTAEQNLFDQVRITRAALPWLKRSFG